jgi:nucleoside-diphosphate-sugar epimerase
MKILVTGSNGFVGRAVCAEAAVRDHAVRQAIRAAATTAADCAVGNIDAQTDWHAALQGVDVVIHLAARVHVMQETATDPLAAFREVNTAGTENLARQAAEMGVKRLVYVSSIKVNGESTAPGQAFCEDEEMLPQDPYGLSKWEAEQALHRVSAETGLEVVVVRPPLVYGPGVKGNFAQMLRVLQRGIPLPLTSVRNLRSLLYVGNLVDALLLCATHSAAAGRTYLVSDGEDVSTPDLLRRLGAALGRPARLFPFPAGLLRGAATLLGRRGQAERLLGSLRIDSGRIRRELDWQPPFTVQQGLQRTTQWYRDHG